LSLSFADRLSKKLKFIYQNPCQKRNSKQFYAIQNISTAQEGSTFKTASPGL